jgi:hypothetical protein
MDFDSQYQSNIVLSTQPPISTGGEMNDISGSSKQNVAINEIKSKRKMSLMQ